MLKYIIAGAIVFTVGKIFGMFAASLGQAAKKWNELSKKDDPCHRCFGASFGDCDKCDRNLIQKFFTDSNGEKVQEK